MMQTIHRVGGKTIMWRLMAPFCVLCGMGLLWVSWLFLAGPSYEDGGPGGPLAMRILFGLLFLAMGIGITIGSCIYGPCYVSRVQVDREEGLVRFSVAGFVRGWSLTVRPEDIVSARDHDGYYDSGRSVVNAPWTTVRLRGRRLPLIVDQQVAFEDYAALHKLLTHQSLALEPVRKWETRKWVEPAKKRKSMKKKVR
jgi:hypothetical protein